ncbi:Rne/Rng family ribonuclease [Rickettsiales endosymbiont of Stachyamoeba lipophora]|uniref:Rne/Rng family ribonuclease n=1 Tax=Rickettsiales endosymbiont of Stachyamoeba lipophora TaxID=2486578 RepID=UPI000F652CBB|nr:Rne/Rng family ribonuclease [Rickettsiales endosymbiont of Stachyamoeba lipophora]AZL15857.1 Rne/Rng family ribonuclease [Rickettsiales endosymbiont of Stachyamoeba lipophora]
MTVRMLVDATYSEETRVATCSNNVVEDFDFETSTKKQLKGNIYLGRITRIEGSLQAAFIEYGAGKHGFLSFSEIHPDYYYLEEEENGSFDPYAKLRSILESRELLLPSVAPEDEEIPISSSDVEEPNLVVEQPAPEILELKEDSSFVADSISEELDAELHDKLQRRHKIQDVIKKDQIILIQVIKEERGNKGASFTSYISLAGRYCVLMPNSIRQGGISRRIANPDARRRIKEIIDNLSLPEGAGVIIRTAGADRSKGEIKRDYEYLVKLWNEVRKKVSSTNAPEFIHAESDLIKRCLRDNYDSSVDEIVIQGEKAYKTAKDFIKMMMPDQISKLKPYKSKVPIFTRYKIEEQLSSMFSTNVPLPAGGYLVINPTEALTSVDINSGRSTSESNVEETALKTNLEAAQEIARQLRLRDVAGLVVVDFIDMIEPKNRAAVENCLRQALQKDRAKIQVSRISPLGLLEMSRQRLRSSFMESHTHTCQHCQGRGRVRVIETMAVEILRAVEIELVYGDYESVNVHLGFEHAAYLFNFHKADITQLELKHKVRIYFLPSEHIIGEEYIIEKTKRSKPLKKEQIADEESEIEEEVVRSYAQRQPRKDANEVMRDTQTESAFEEVSNVEVIEGVLKATKEGAYRKPARQRNNRRNRHNKYKKRSTMERVSINDDHHERNEERELEYVGEAKHPTSRNTSETSLLKELWKRIID